MIVKKERIISVSLFILSAVLFMISMPPFFNIPFLGFFALVPAILSLRIYGSKINAILIPIFFGLLYTSITYSWYTDIFSGIWGYALIVAVAFWHSSLIRNGVKFEKKLPLNLKVFALPIVYSLLEFAQRNIPVIKEWWFIPYAKTQWGFPESLQLLSITGISGVTFILILSNSTIAKIIQNLLERKKTSKVLFVNMLVIVGVLAFGFYNVNNPFDSQENNSYKIALVSDMANTLSGETHEGYYVQDRKLTQKILNQNIALTKKILSNKEMNKNDNTDFDVDFTVWSENEFFNFDDTETQEKLKAFAQEFKTYLIVDSYKKENNKLYDMAVLISPDKDDDKNIADFSKKTHLFNGELNAGFSPAPNLPKAIKTEKTKVGLGVCYDFHFLDVVKNLAKDGAKIILMPTDDDMNQNYFFPYYHATDAVFRAIEHNIAVASANTNGASILVNPNGKIIAFSPVNKAASVKGTVFTVKGITLYTKLGEWFAYILLIIFLFIIALKIKNCR